VEFNQLVKLLEQDQSIFKPRKTEGRRERFNQIIQRQIQDYIKNGSKGDLSLPGTPITSLPDNLKYVGGILDLSNTLITSLPAGLKVGGCCLDLSRTPITTLPDNLTVVGNLYVDRTQITSLPGNLKVGGLYIHDTQIASLPDNLSVDELDAHSTLIQEFPDSLKIRNWLDIRNTPLAEKYRKGVLTLAQRLEQFKKTYPGVNGQIYL